MKKGIVIPFDGTLRRTANTANLEDLKVFFKEKKTTKSSLTAKSTTLVCTETKYVTQSLCPADPHHSNGQPCTAPGSINGYWWGYTLKTVISCQSGDIWSWQADSQSYTTSVPDPSVTQGGGSYSSTATVQPNLFDDASLFQPFINDFGLVGQEIEWARYRPNRNKIFYYMEENDYSSGTKAMIKNVISQIVANSSLKIDFDASLDSPMNVDKLNITNTTPEEKKFNEVYNALTNSPEFKKLFTDLFVVPAPRFNAKFVIGNTTNGQPAETKTDINNPINNTIIISPSFLLNNNKMTIAKTIIHECIHAYLNVKLCDAGQGMSISTLNNMDFWNTVNQKYNGFIDPQDQHNFIYTYMLPTMKTILADVTNTLVSSEEKLSLQDLVFHPPGTPTVDVPFNWNDFYQNLSLSGLQDCTFFKNEIGTLSKNPTTGEFEVTITIDPIKMYYYNKYYTYAQIYLRK